MEIPAGKYCNQEQEPNCPFVRCLFLHDVPTTCILDIYRWMDVVTKRCKECLAAYPNGAVVTITPKELPKHDSRKK